MDFFLMVAFALLPGVATVPWAGPDATPTNKPHAVHEGWSPATTGLAGLVGKGYELFKRQGVPTCGYIDGLSCKLGQGLSCDATNSITARPVTCGEFGDVCVTNAYYGAFGCCPGTDITDCPLATSCLPYASLAECDAACQANPYITVCDSGSPYCQYDIFIFPNTELTYFGCAAVAAVITVYPTYSGGSATVSYATFSITTVTASAAIPSTTTSSTITSSTTSRSATPTSSPASSPAGAIAGGVVGGIAVLAALGFGIFFVLSRRRRDNASGAGGVGASGGPPPTDPKPPINSYAAPEGSGFAGAGGGVAAASPMGGAHPEYYGQSNAAGAPPGKTFAITSTTPIPPSSPPEQHYMNYAHESMPVGGYSSQPPVMAPVSPAPPYVAEMTQAGSVSPVGNNMSPPMGNTNMIDGTQIWPAGPGVYEALGSTPGQPSGR